MFTSFLKNIRETTLHIAERINAHCIATSRLYERGLGQSGLGGANERCSVDEVERNWAKESASLHQEKKLFDEQMRGESRKG